MFKSRKPNQNAMGDSLEVAGATGATAHYVELQNEPDHTHIGQHSHQRSQISHHDEEDDCACISASFNGAWKCVQQIAQFAHNWTGISYFAKVAAPVVCIEGREYRLRQKHGEGGFSFVYIAEDVETGTLYALKLSRCQTREQIEHCRWEMRMYLEFNHPNLMPLVGKDFINGANDDDKQAAFLFPFFTEGTCQDFLDAHRATQQYFKESECLRIIRAVADGVSHFHCHDPPLVHGDIKPGNILLDSSKNPVLMDFGSVNMGRQEVRSRSDFLRVQETAAINSSMPYRAPELFQPQIGSMITCKSDIWSLGCTLYSLAFGYSPFEVEWRDDGIPRIVEPTALRIIGRWKFPPVAETHYSGHFRTLIQRLLSINPEKRPTGEELVHIVDNLQHSAV